MTKEERLKKRHQAEKRFRFYGLTSIFVALLFVVILVQNIFSKGSSAFKKTVITTEIFFDQELLEIQNGASEEDIMEADFYNLMIENLIKTYPAKDRDEEDELLRLFSGDAEIEIKKAFLKDNNLIGKTITLDLTASDDIDQLHKGNYPRDLPEERRKSVDEILALPRPNSAPPQQPPLQASDDVINKWGKEYQKWKDDNKHLPKLLDSKQIIDNFKKRRDAAANKNVAVDPNQEARLQRLEQKMDKLMKHLGVK